MLFLEDLRKELDLTLKDVLPPDYLKSVEEEMAKKEAETEAKETKEINDNKGEDAIKAEAAPAPAVETAPTCKV